MEIMIPTFKRWDKLVGKDYFKQAKYVLPESQRDEYFKVLKDKERMVVIPDKADGNIARKRNWILKNVDRPVLMIDDDVRAITHSEKDDRDEVQGQIELEPGEVMEFIENGFNLAYQWGCVFWGVNVNTDRRSYQQYKPFSLTQVVLGPLQGHLKHGLLYDERMGTKDDYDFSLQVLRRYNKLLRFNKFAYSCEHGENAGGIVSMRTKRVEIKYCNAIMKKWGKEVIRYDIESGKLADLLNARVNVPIDGV